MNEADHAKYIAPALARRRLDLMQPVDKKIAINAQKYPADKVRGSAKKYNEYE